jgi:type IV pilus assembly protein PilA
MIMNITQKHRTTPAAPAGQDGFTIIELMIIVAIVSILAVIALPAYQDYTVRSKVSEGVTTMAEAKTSVTSRYAASNIMPTSNAEAGLAPPDSYDELEFVKRMEISSVPVKGTIILTFKIPNSEANDKQLQLVPSTTTGLIVWTCEPVVGPQGIETKHVPANCRG